MEHTKELLSIDLSKLMPSPHNERRHTAGQVEELAALIDSQGLLHKRVVTAQVNGRGRARKLKFAVAAGERRRRALMLLRQRSRLPKGREATHPADEFDAFKALIDEIKGVEDVAARIGVSLLTEQRRLKPAALYREDSTSLDRFIALAEGADRSGAQGSRA